MTSGDSKVKEQVSKIVLARAKFRPSGASGVWAFSFALSGPRLRRFLWLATPANTYNPRLPAHLAICPTCGLLPC